MNNIIEYKYCWWSSTLSPPSSTLDSRLRPMDSLDLPDPQIAGCWLSPSEQYRHVRWWHSQLNGKSSSHVPNHLPWIPWYQDSFWLLTLLGLLDAALSGLALLVEGVLSSVSRTGGRYSRYPGAAKMERFHNKICQNAYSIYVLANWVWHIRVYISWYIYIYYIYVTCTCVYIDIGMLVWCNIMQCQYCNAMRCSAINICISIYAQKRLEHALHWEQPGF